jgi:hypothetical protein
LFQPEINWRWKQIVSSRNQPWLIQPEFYSHPELKQP